MEKKASPEAIELQKGINDKWIEVKKTSINSLLITQKIGEGEKEVISLAAKNKAIAILDDDTARGYATILQIETHGTIYVLLLAIKKRIITKAKGTMFLNTMLAKGFYMSTEIYIKTQQMIDSL